MPEFSHRINVLCMSGHDPTGGAGLQADVMACAAAGTHALGLITALTAQDTQNVRRVWPVPADQLQEQLDTLLDDCPVQAIKIGLLGTPDQIDVVTAAIHRCAAPVVVDPVLRAGGGRELSSDALQSALLANLAPLTTVLTPNAAEARRLMPHAKDLDACADGLLAAGCRHVLITGGDEPSDTVENRWYGQDGESRTFHWPRVSGTFHGAGCTLASAIAARLACGESIGHAIENAQAYVAGTLQHAYRVGGGRAIPYRL